jgi:hypothetical protein
MNRVMTAAAETSPLDGVLKRCRELLDLPADWDDAGASRIHPDTIEAACSLIESAESKALDRYGRSLPMPKVSPCTDGSVDLFWKTDAYRLLINIQPNDGAPSDFFGETKSGLTFRGTFPTRSQDPQLVPLFVDLMSAA